MAMKPSLPFIETLLGLIRIPTRLIMPGVYPAPQKTTDQILKELDDLRDNLTDDQIGDYYSERGNG